MKTFRLPIVTLIMIFLLSNILVGCGANTTTEEIKPNDTSNIQPTTSEEVKATEDVGPITINAYTGMTDEQWQVIMDGFNAKFPDEKIQVKNLVISGTVDEMLNKITLITASGGDLDLIAMNNDDFYDKLYNLGVLEPLNANIEKDGIELDSISGMLEKGYRDNELYGLPFRNSVWVTYYNKNIFDEANVPYPDENWTWDDFREIAMKLTKGEGVDKTWGAVMPTWPQTWSSIATQAGAGYYVDGVPNLTDPRFEAAAMLKYNMTMVDKSIETLAENVMSKVHYAKAFATGNYGMLTVGEWTIGQLKDNFAGEVPFEYDIQVLPHPEGTKPTTWGTTAWVGVGKNSEQEKKDAAWKIASFMNSDDGAILYASINQMPARNSETAKAAFLENVPSFVKNGDALFADYTYCEEKPTGAGASIYYGILDETSQLILTGEVGANKALADANERIINEIKSSK